jgi:hypothetical protein
MPGQNGLGAMARITFEDVKKAFLVHATNPETARRFSDADCVWTESDRGWFMFVGYEQRGYAVFLQRAFDEREIHVRAGCRYFSLRRAMAHWGRRVQGQQGKQILQLIAIGLRRAANRGLIKRRFFPHYFDDKLRR